MLAFAGTSYNEVKLTLTNLLLNEDAIEFFLLAMSQFLANIVTESFYFLLWKCDRNSGRRFCMIYTHCRELKKSVGSHASLSLLFMLKLMV
jgi:hypothetical protein